MSSVRDGSPDEDGGVLSLAKDAALAFQARRFSECIDVLNQILQKKEDDPKVLHNIAVAEYFRDGCSDPRKLLDVLNKVKKRSEDLARASREQLEVSSNIGSNAISGSKGSGTYLHQFSAANTSSIAYADEFDISIVTLNTSVVLYHLREYSRALSLLDQLYQNIEPLDETTALHICLLLLDVALASQDASKAADVIQYLEKKFGVGNVIKQGDNGSLAQHPSSNQSSKVSAAPSSLAAPDAYSLDLSSIANASESSLVRTLSDEALDYETLLSTLDIGGQNMARPASNDLSRTSADRIASAIDLKLTLHVYKVRLLLLTRNPKAAKREVKLAMNIARGRDSSTVLLLKSQLEYARGNHPKAVKLLMTSSNGTEAGLISMFYNNLGCIYHRLRKHNLSCVLFTKALRSSSSLRSEKPLKLATFSQDKSLLIVYNCGLQYLACGKPLVAARCFYKASPVFYHQPLLWLRLAECCLLAQEKGLLRSTRDPSSGREEVKLNVIGSGKWQRLMVDANLRIRHLDSTCEDGLFSDDDCYRLSIPFARMCLNNALHLLNALEKKISKSTTAHVPTSEGDHSNQACKNSNQKSISGSDSNVSNESVVAPLANANGDSKEAKGGTSSVSAYMDIGRKENHMIKLAVLADLAYVELCLENPLKALSAAKELLQLPNCSRIYLFICHVYAAEALCRLNRPKEAAEQLFIYISDGRNVELPYNNEDRNMWDLDKGSDSEELKGFSSAQKTFAEDPRSVAFLNPEDARGTLYVNLAAIYAMQGDLDQASHFARVALSALPNDPRVWLAAVYVDLRLGKTQDALAKLKRCSHVRFFPTSITLSSSQ